MREKQNFLFGCVCIALATLIFSTMEVVLKLPAVEGVEILINNAGVQDSGRDIDVNLRGAIYCTEKYGIQPNI